MDPLISTGLVLVLMAAVVLAFRRLVRRPKGVSPRDPPGVRTVAVFAGDDPELFGDDGPEEPFVGVRLFEQLCAGLAAGRVRIDHRGTIENAQRAECLAGNERFALVLEWIDRRWVAGIEWVPQTPAEKRHLALTGQVFAPPDSRELRQVLLALDDGLKAHPKLSDVRWYRKEQWIAEDTSDPGETPVSPED
jgi:hypothetical protein